ncbi:hypothetical protein Tco_0045765 [Tanacetum coccineum]
MAKLRFRIFKVESLKVMRVVLEKNQAIDITVFNIVGNAWTNQPREENDECEDLQLQATTNFKPEHVDAYDLDYDNEAIANAIFMENLSPVGSINGDTVEPCYDSDILSEVPYYDNYQESDMFNSNVQDMGYIKNIVSNNESYDELTSNINVISYADYMVTISNNADNYVPPHVQKNDMILSVIKQMKSLVEKCNTVNQEKQSVNESLTSELERYKERIKTLENESKNSASDREKILDRELRTVICDHNRKVTDFENHVFSQQKQMKDLTNQNSANVWLSSNDCLFSANHDACVVKYLNDVQKRKKAKSIKQKEKKQCKPTGRVFTSVGLRWKPTRRMFNMEGKIIQISPATIVPPGNRLYTIKIPTIVEIVLWYLDLRCSKHMIGRDKLYKFIGTVRFDNDHFATIMGYEDLQMGNILISRVYYVKGLGHNLFFVGQFSNSDLKIAFRKHTCFVRNLEGVDLLSGSRGSNLYTISMADMMKSSPIFLLSKASKIKSWLWHHRLSHLKFAPSISLLNKVLSKGYLN